MIIAGLDVSLNSTGIVKAVVDDNIEIRQLDWLGFTDIKKTADKNNKLFYYKKFDNYIEKNLWMREKIINFLFPGYCVDYVAIEDYAYSSAGRVFHIGGFTEMIKTEVYERGTALRWYEIPLIKKFATTKGNADKLSMYDAFLKIPVEQRIDISSLPEVTNGKTGKSPTSDIIDAFFILKLLQTELKLRRGFIQLKDMTEDMIWVFNRATPTAKENILTREFLKRNLLTQI